MYKKAFIATSTVHPFSRQSCLKANLNLWWHSGLKLILCVRIKKPSGIKKKKNAEGMRGSRSAVRNLGQNHTHGATFVRLCLGQTAFRYGYKDPVMSY